MAEPSDPSLVPVRLHRQGAWARVTVDRPEARNAISTAVMGSLEGILDELEADPPSVVAFRGGGDRAFVSGGDLKEFTAIRTLEDAQAMARRVRAIFDRVVGLRSVTIAELNGHALGGGAELSLACDMRIAVTGVKIGFSQSQLGITPAWGGMERLAELAGRARALYLMTTGTAIGAEQAAAWGLVEEVIARERFGERAATLLAELAGRPPAVLAAVKDIVSTVRPGLHPASADDAILQFAQTWVSDAHWDAVRAVRTATS
jgi:enoyl-CoA hydratase